jgi:hypothetical protein
MLAAGVIGAGQVPRLDAARLQSKIDRITRLSRERQDHCFGRR